MENFIVIAVLAFVIGCAILYIVKAKKKGVKCVGCPYADTCSKSADSGSCSCNNEN